MEFRLLGSVSVASEAGDLPLGPAKRTSLLAALLLRPNHPVPLRQLTASLWDGEPPARARSVIQGHVSRLRTLLDTVEAGSFGVELATQGAAYVLRMPEALLDAHRFEEMVTRAQGQCSVGDSVVMYQEALALWRGPALTGVHPTPPLQLAADALEELRLTTVEHLAAGYGRLGAHAQAAAVLRAEAGAHPLRESLAAALVTALRRAGRRSEALDWFHHTRRLLAEELGVDPGDELSDAYAAALRGQSCETGQSGPGARSGAEDHGGRTGAAREGAYAPPRIPAPRTRYADTLDLMPRPPRGFHGREAELAALSGATAAEAPVCLVTGPAGVGKSALVVHWAHLHQDRFPDGRLHADLRGFSDTGEAAPLDVLREFLLALGVEPLRLPETVTRAAALFRSLTAGRRLLIVLDNVRASEQVRPLLPGGSECVTVVTSRHRLRGLIASDAARPVPLGVLGPEDGTALLAAVLGTDRVHTEPLAARQLARLCDGLPLALRVAAARLADQPHLSLTAMAAELSDTTRRLGLLDAEDTGVRAALHLSVRRLPPGAAHQLAHLGRHPGTHIDRDVAAALAGTGPAEAEAALDQLAAAHLLTYGAPGRWVLHDLVRLYARDMETGPEALPRLLDLYIATGLAAAGAAERDGTPCFATPADFGRPQEVREFRDRDEAMAWYTAQREDLALAAAAAHAAGLHGRAWRIVLSLWPLMVWRVLDGWAPLLRTALDSARADEDPHGQSRVLALLGWVLTEEGRPEEAMAHLEAACLLAARAGDRGAQATALVNLSLARAALGELDVAARGCVRAAELAREAGDPATERLALYHLSRHQLGSGEWREALESTTAAGAVRAPAAESPTRVLLLAATGEALVALGERTEGIRCLDEAARAAESSGFDEGAERALGALLQLSDTDAGDGARGVDGTAYRARYAEVAARQTVRA
ncbi:NB-ARC domain-containing protein [Streptomyces sp. NBC_00536]|uniref:AfsR/SARP family transcriptional regulator n=1 Tax=Streptomyces sp. NBC_00536 TaxID=2975769 RepID=UPI002E807B74|nr:BTAD domain-containing putative transcriptional regulator [Streptomyces sp. NBC_00536]WUC79975.1 NB-ARC domain-containing protein [Streptomyces sp. NBC_00536]